MQFSNVSHNGRVNAGQSTEFGFQGTGDGPRPDPPVFDTVRRVSGDRTCRETVDRDTLRLTQTPQLFSRGCLHAAYRRAAATGTVFTDDAAAVADAGERVLAVPGSPRNFKITVDGDLALAQALVPEVAQAVRTVLAQPRSMRSLLWSMRSMVAEN